MGRSQSHSSIKGVRPQPGKHLPLVVFHAWALLPTKTRKRSTCTDATKAFVNRPTSPQLCLSPVMISPPESLATFQGCARPRAQHCPMNRRFQGLLPAPGLRALLRPGTGALRHLCGESTTVSLMIGVSLERWRGLTAGNGFPRFGPKCFSSLRPASCHQSVVAGSFAGTPCLSQTMRMPTSDGETPEMREAWPRVAG